MSSPAQLMIVLPVFNEQACVRKVILEWFQEIEDWTEDFVFVVINDGSTDETTKILARLKDRLGSRLEVVERTNHGHGQSCLFGYQMAIERQIPFVFQIDSDGQCDPQFFFRFWRLRHEYDVIYGHRTRRDDGWRRMLASIILKWTLLLTSGAWCSDAMCRIASCERPFLRTPCRKSVPNSHFRILLSPCCSGGATASASMPSPSDFANVMGENPVSHSTVLAKRLGNWSASFAD